jgi:hypothetical protein
MGHGSAQMQECGGEEVMKDGETEGRRDGETEGRRDGGTEGRRDGATEGRSDGETNQSQQTTDYGPLTTSASLAAELRPPSSPAKGEWVMARVACGTWTCPVSGRAVIGPLPLGPRTLTGHALIAPQGPPSSPRRG